MKRATTADIERIARDYQAEGAILITIDGNSANVIWAGCTKELAAEVLRQMTESVRRGGRVVG